MPNQPYKLGDRVIFTDERGQAQEGVVSNIDIAEMPDRIAIDVKGGISSYVRRVTEVRPVKGKGRTGK